MFCKDKAGDDLIVRIKRLDETGVPCRHKDGLHMYSRLDNVQKSRFYYLDGVNAADISKYSCPNLHSLQSKHVLEFSKYEAKFVVKHANRVNTNIILTNHGMK